MANKKEVEFKLQVVQPQEKEMKVIGSSKINIPNLTINQEKNAKPKTKKKKTATSKEKTIKKTTSKKTRTNKEIE